MNKAPIWRGWMGAAALTLLFGAGQATRAAGDEALKAHGPIAWTDSLAKAQKTAAKEKKVIFVDFYAEWCGPCKEMLKTTYQDKKVVSRSKEFVPVLIDVDKQQDLAKKYGVRAIPTVVFLDAKGKVLSQSVGLKGAQDFLKMMDEAKKKAKA